MIETIEDIDGIGPEKAEALRRAGFESVDELQAATVTALTRAEGIGSATAKRIKEQLRTATSARVAPSERETAPASTMKGPSLEDLSVTRPQAEHLSSVASVASDELVGRTARDIRDRLADLTEVEFLGFRRVCGRVLKPDPETGERQPVPNATIHVEDTDCSFLGYFPDETPYGWFYPFGCSREEITTTTTDECGNFCVFVPRWDIDRVLRFRRGRLCLPDLVRPDIRDILERPRFLPEPVFPPRPQPRPDPVPPLEPRLGLEAPGRFDRISDLIGRDTAINLTGPTAEPRFGKQRGGPTELLNRPAFDPSMPPPLPAEFHQIDREELPERIPDLIDLDVDIEPEVWERIDFDRYIGPFLKCRDVIIPVWTTLFDVPDITFRVTQDVDRDGDEEEIYGEGFFEVRWNADSFEDLILEASEDAISVPFCDEEELTPQDPECAEPSIETVGLMAARSPYIDTTSGYATRVNRPKPGGSRPPAETPFAGTLQLHGCHRFEEATYYRVLYTHEGGSEQAFTGQQWYAPAIGRDPVHVQPADEEGWYPIMDVPWLESYYGETLSDNPLIFPYWFFNWNTRRYPNGKYTVQLQLGDGNRTEVDRSAGTSFVVDNRRPVVSINTIEWQEADNGTTADDWNDISDTCPVIRRTAGISVHIRVKFHVSATHLRSLSLEAGGCQANPKVVDSSGGSGSSSYGYWHQSVSDNAHAGTVTFEVPGAANYPEGAYRIALTGNSRAFNPSGSGPGPGPAMWKIDPVYIDAHTSRGIAIIDV